VVSSVAMIAASVGTTAASATPLAHTVNATSKPGLSGGVLDRNNNLKVYGGQVAASVGSGSALSIGTQTGRTRSTDMLLQPFVTYAYKWYRFDGSAYSVIGGATGARYNASSADVGYTLLVRQRSCYLDPLDEAANVCSGGSATPDLSWSEPSAKVTFFASTDPAVSSIVANKISVTNIGTWQGYVPGSTKSFQWQSCTGNGTGCSDISGATSQKLTLTSAQGGKGIRAKMTLTTTQGEGVSADSYSNTVYYNGDPVFYGGGGFTSTLAPLPTTPTGTHTLPFTFSDSGLLHYSICNSSSTFQTITMKWNTSNYSQSPSVGACSGALADYGVIPMMTLAETMTMTGPAGISVTVGQGSSRIIGGL